MEAGYDWLLVRARLQRRVLRVSALFVLVLGALLMAGSGTYYGYAANARADLDRLNVTLPGAVGTLSAPVQEPPTAPAAQVWGPAVVQSAASGSLEGQVDHGRAADLAYDRSGPDSSPSLTPLAAEVAAPPELATELRRVPAWAIASQGAYPRPGLASGAWTNPLAYEPASYVDQVSLHGFTPLSLGQALPLGSQAAPRRIMVLPTTDLEIDAAVAPLRILNLGDSRAYETPNRTVGHIPESANPGEGGSSWFFGHLETPILGGGSVFYDLPRVPTLLREGREVYIIADNGAKQYLYRVTSTRVVHQDDLVLYDSGQATVHLVACVPRLVYDYRLIVSGELVGVKQLR